jgi:hypothetical protein
MGSIMVGAAFWSPQALAEACVHNRKKQRDEEAVLIEKAEEKERKRVAKTYKHQWIEQCKVERKAKAETWCKKLDLCWPQ